MLIDVPRSFLLVIDVQEKLLPTISDHDRVSANLTWLVRAAQRLGIPVAATEHCAKNLGPTVPAIRSLLLPEAIGATTRFSAVAGKCLPGLPGADRPQVIMAGIEAHIGVLQTALELLEEGKEVYVVADCVGSRRESDCELALARVRQEGARIVSREMVVYEWLGEAGTQLFKDIRREFLR